MQPQQPYTGVFLLLRYLLTYKWRFTLMSVCIIASIVFQIINPIFAQNFINSAVSGTNGNMLYGDASYFLLFAGIAYVLSLAAAYFSQDIGWRASNVLREELLLHCLTRDQSWLNGKTPGEFIERIDGDLSVLADFFGEFIVRIIGYSLMAIGITIVVTCFNGLAGLIFFSCLAGSVLLIRLTNTAVVHAGVHERQADAELFGFMEEALRGREDIKFNGGAKYALYKYFLSAKKLFVNGRRSNFMKTITWAVTYISYYSTTAIILLVSYFLYRHNYISLGAAFVFYQYISILQNPIEQLTQQTQKMQSAQSSAKRIAELFAVSAKIIGGANSLSEQKSDITFNHVTFFYDEEKTPALQDITLHIPAGKTVGVIGRTGSGKTTFSRLLARIYDPQIGSIYIGEKDIRSIELSALRAHIAVAPQDVQLFHATVRENITFFDPTISDDTILALIQTMRLESWLNRLPNGLDTMLESHGEGLSAGESQFLAFIRILLQHPKIIILDEPSSRLDPITESLMTTCIQQLCAEKTGIIIAHRLKTIQQADYILALEDGKIIEYDTRENLENNPQSYYSGLIKANSTGVLF